MFFFKNFDILMLKIKRKIKNYFNIMSNKNNNTIHYYIKYKLNVFDVIYIT